MDKVFDKRQFAKDIILKRMLDKRMPLRYAAEECGVHFSNLSRYERQENEPTIEHLLKICVWLKTDSNKYFIEGE